MLDNKLILRKLMDSKYILFSLGILFLVFCIAIDPTGLGNNRGFSYYGTMARTLFPYSLSLLFMAIFVYPGKRKYPYKLNILTRLISFLYLFLILVPYTFSSIFNNLHIATSSSLFFLQLVASLLFYLATKKNSFLYSLIIQFLFGVASGLFIIYPKGYLIQFQVIYQITFMIAYLNFLRFIYAKKSTKNVKI